MVKCVNSLLEYIPKVYHGWFSPSWYTFVVLSSLCPLGVSGMGFLLAYTVFCGMSYIVLILIASVSLHVSFVFVTLWKTFTCDRPNTLRNRSISFSLFEFVIHKKSEVYKQCLRTCLSCLKKGMFLPLERPLLDCRRASSSMEKGVSSKREGRSCRNILTISVRLISVSSFT